MSKKLIYAISAMFLILSIGALLVNMPQKKEKTIYNQIIAYFPYKLKKELGGLDIVDLKTGKDLDIANSKVFLAWDDLLKKWGKTHLKLKKDTLIIQDDKNQKLKEIKLNKSQKEWIKKFFNIN